MEYESQDRNTETTGEGEGAIESENNDDAVSAQEDTPQADHDGSDTPQENDSIHSLLCCPRGSSAEPIEVNLSDLKVNFIFNEWFVVMLK